uniref:Uncharacterized protein n=1 Tax=Arundo donax TaxID=35708 RepID=A0A0A8XPN2_ARUDO
MRSTSFSSYSERQMTHWVSAPEESEAPEPRGPPAKARVGKAATAAGSRPAPPLAPAGWRATWTAKA